MDSRARHCQDKYESSIAGNIENAIAEALQHAYPIALGRVRESCTAEEIPYSLGVFRRPLIDKALVEASEQCGLRFEPRFTARATSQFTLFKAGGIWFTVSGVPRHDVRVRSAAFREFLMASNQLAFGFIPPARSDAAPTVVYGILKHGPRHNDPSAPGFAVLEFPDEHGNVVHRVDILARTAVNVQVVPEEVVADLPLVKIISRPREERA